MDDYAARGTPFLVVVDFELRQPVIYALEMLPGSIRFETPGSRVPTPTDHTAPPSRFQKKPMPFADYARACELIRDEARAGRTYLANLTFPTPIRTELSLDEMYRIGRAKFKLLFDDRFVVFSPERFVCTKNGRIYTEPMKGTIDASLPNARARLLDAEKERAEHVTIVDLLRNDLGMHATDVRVERFRFVDRIDTNDKSLLQVSSRISARLPEGYRRCLGEIFFSLLPAGSVSGAPKIETLRIIRAAEGAPRGFFTGVMGYYDGIEFDSAVLIRFVEQIDGQLVYRSGGGITYLSDPASEYQEMLDKVYLPL